MSIGYVLGLLILGLIAGVLSSMIGIGGGIIIVPSLVLFFHFNQLNAQGTSLAMLLPPIGILGVYEYYKTGAIDFKVVVILCVAFVLGAFFGGKLVMRLDKEVVKKIFAVFMVVIAVKMLFFDKPSARVVVPENTSRSAGTSH